MDQLHGRHALVTGGARGIGLAIARELLRSGAAVTLAGRDPATLDSAAAELAPLGTVRCVRMDVADAVSVDQGMGAATKAGGRIDVLVNNAGQAGSAAVAKTDDALWARMLAVNLSGTFYCSRAVLPAMLQAGWGRIVNVASTAGLIGYAYTAAYCASKHGVIGLTRAMALEVATKGVTVNAVCPGFTETDLGREAIANISARTGRSEPEAKAALAAFNPQRRLVQPEEVANAAVWLCLPASGAMNGQAIAVAGGEVT
ncbi:MAG: SDR family NAD(P)-dependent oxidoreductase [Pigmentiphaga sp.]|uniref:SDR family NAD(P)-dependent oxidoreductase n=1 Tax=Pigmentiphaga sp. TaxID=1977564 RepID=UPI0029A752CB|nr:SDR family NAD(P)-dependent oxidoreductase [Pigmentiphaga sp.]MDX3907754.1 SDR family NAD(P)-dependent oxidoreductase [Pigmentiphaga sp.]